MITSTANDLASGSEDIAALLGLFCTDGVERNALAFQYGWGTVAASSLSLLGILGLIKSSIKLALGLKLCSSAGFNLKSIRGVFGYLPGESATAGDLSECFLASVTVGPEKITIHKTRHYFSGANTPIINAAAPPKPKPFSTVVNLGNREGESSFYQSTFLIIPSVVFCSGLTSWLLLIITADWSWVKIFAIPILHMCLVLMLGLLLWYGRQINRPQKHLTSARWEALCGRPVERPTVLNLLQVCKKGSRNGGYKETIDILHFRGDISLIHSRVLKICVLVLSATAATAYICQYSILKVASTKEALIWLGCQGSLAAIRILYWIFDPSFDDPAIANAECAVISSVYSDHLMFMEIICAAAPDVTIEIPIWAWDYLSKKPLRELILSAADRKVGRSIPLDTECYEFLNIDLKRVLYRRGIEENKMDDGYDDGDCNFRLGLFRLPGDTCQEFFLVGLSPLLILASSNLPAQVWHEDLHIPTWFDEVQRSIWRNDVPSIDTDYKYWIEATSLRLENSDDSDVFYRKCEVEAETYLCTLFAINDSGQRIRLCAHPAGSYVSKCPWSKGDSQELRNSEAFDIGFNTRYHIYFDQSRACAWLMRVAHGGILGKEKDYIRDSEDKILESSVVITSKSVHEAIDKPITEALEEVRKRISDRNRKENHPLCWRYRWIYKKFRTSLIPGQLGEKTDEQSSA